MAQPALPQFEIFWIEKVPTDSVVDLKLTWYPSATLDTNEVQFIECDHSGAILKTCGVKFASDTAIKVTITSEGFKQNSIVFLRWRAYNTEGDSGWSDVVWFATNEMTAQPILLQPTKGGTVQ